MTAPLRRTVLAAAAAFLGACATPRPLPPLPADDSLASRCERTYAALDAAIEASGVRDAEATRIAGFPAVRVTRFLASFTVPAPDAATFDAWLSHLRDEDRRARLVEIANLPPQPTAAVRETLAAEGFGALPPAAFLEGCGGALAQRDAGDPVRRAALLAAAVVPDDYDDGARALGFYPITRIGFAAGIRWYEHGVQTAFASPREPRPLEVHLAEDATALDAASVRQLLDRSRRDPLGVPALDAVDVERLLATYAPVLEVEARNANDRIGRPVHGTASAPGFEAAPIVFGRIAYTRFAGRTHVQLVYTTWFAARPAAYPLDPLAGHLDAVLWRVTLDDDGTPLVLDSIHACGCYGIFVATPRVALRPPPASLDEQALVVAELPGLHVGQAIAVRLESGTHYVRGVRVLEAPPAHATRYRIARDDALRTLPLPGGGTRSLYGPEGIVPGTGRAERYLFWPLGIRDAGAMRQWGRHATAFVGRRHFDEAFLLDRYFLPAP